MVSTVNRLITLESLKKVIVICIFIFVFCSTFSIALTQIAYYSAFIMWLFLIVIKKGKILKTPLDMFFGLYFLIEVVTTILSLDRIDALLHIQKRLLLIPVVYLIVRFIDTREKVINLVTIFFISAIMIGIVSDFLIFKNFSQYAHYLLRFDSYNNPMTIGGLTMIVPLMLIPFALHPQTPKTQRMLAAVGISVTIFVLIFTFTRSSWLGFFAGAIIISILKDKRILYFIGILVLFLAIFGSSELHARFFSIFDPYAGYNAERLEMWAAGIQIFKKFPILGIGDIGFNYISPQFTSDGRYYGHLHNNLLMWLVTLGVIGFMIVISLFVAIWRVFWKTNRAVKDDWLYGSVTIGALAVFVGFQVNGLFEWNFGDAEIYFLFLMITGVVLSIQRLAENNSIPK